MTLYTFSWRAAPGLIDAALRRRHMDLLLLSGNLEMGKSLRQKTKLIFRHFWCSSRSVDGLQMFPRSGSSANLSRRGVWVPLPASSPAEMELKVDKISVIV